MEGIQDHPIADGSRELLECVVKTTGTKKAEGKQALIKTKMNKFHFELLRRLSDARASLFVRFICLNQGDKESRDT